MKKNKLLLKQARILSIPEKWSIARIGDCCSIRNDLRKPISVNDRAMIQGEYPYYGPTGVLDYINEFLVEGEFALIGEDGDHFLKPNEKKQTIFAQGQFNVNNHAHLIESTKHCSSQWFAVFFRHRDITDFLSRQGANRYKLNKATLEKLPILLPPLPEQKAIAELLSTWDEAIEKTERLILAKEKGFQWLLRELISEPKKNAEKHGWKRVELGKIIVERNEKSNIHDQYSTLTSSRRGLFYQSDYFSKQVTSLNNEGYKIIKKGDFTYRAMSDDGKFAFNRLEFCNHGIISPAYGIFYPRNVNSNFLLFYINSSAFFRELSKESQGGTRISLKLNAMKNIMISIPPTNLQNQIAETLSTAQQEVNLLKQLAEQYKTQKRGLMQKILTGEWRVKPKIVKTFEGS